MGFLTFVKVKFNPYVIAKWMEVGKWKYMQYIAVK